MADDYVFRTLAREFRDLNDFVHLGGTPSAARQHLVDLACASIPECGWAGITLRPPDARPRTLAYSGDTAYELDQVQYEIGDGPCLEAARTGGAVQSADLSVETRWPRFCAAALERSLVRGVASFHLTDHPVPTALNLYTASAGAFDDHAISVAALFATHASTLVTHADTSHQAATLGNALATSRQIGAAVGILMAVHKVPEPEAFDLLRRSSNDLNRKLHDIAQDVTDIGELPGRP